MTTLDDDDLDHDAPAGADASDTDATVTPEDTEQTEATIEVGDGVEDGDGGAGEIAPFDQDRLDDGPDDVADHDGEDDLDATAPHADLVPPAVPEVRTTRRAHRAELKASARRVRRVVRHVDPWSVFKVASLFIACVWGIVVLASLLIWRAAESTGSVENTEEFIKDIGFRDFDFDPQQMFDALLSAGAVIAIALVFFIVLLTVLFNLICDLTGGLRVTMLEQDLVDARKQRRWGRGNDPADA